MHTVYRNICKRGKRDRDWKHVKRAWNDTSKMILNDKKKYCKKLERKIFYPKEGLKSYWSTLNRLFFMKEPLMFLHY